MSRSLAFAARSHRSPVRGAHLAVLAALLVALGAAGCGKGQGKALVTTGSRHLTVDQFMEYAREPNVIKPYVALPESAQKRALLDDLVSYEVLAEAGARAGFDKDSAYVNLEKQSLPRLLPDALYDKHIGRSMKVSEDEAKLFYDSQKTEYRLAVVVAPDQPAAENALKRLQRGEKFAEVARSTSQDPSTGANGGEIPGWLSLGQLPPDVEKAVAPLKVGEHTNVIPQRTGAYIFTVLESRPRTNATPFEANKAEVTQMLEQRKKSALVEQYLQGLKAKYQLKTEGPGWTVLTDKILVLPDSLSRHLATDPHRAGLSDIDLGQTLATWTGRAYTVRDLIRDMNQTPLNERPPANRTDLVRLFVEGKAMNEILVAEATKEGLANSPSVKRQVERARSAYLVNKFVEKNLPAGGVGFPTPAELDSTTRALVSSTQQKTPTNITFQMLPPQVQQQIVADWQTKHRQAMIKAEVDRLKAEIKPVIDEKAFRAIPWPVPAAADVKEKA